MADEIIENCLYSSEICRLCGEINLNGCNLFDKNNEKGNIISLINYYLPIQVINDGKLPRWICPGCHLQVESTAQFFELVLFGQEKLRKLLKTSKEGSKIQSVPKSLLKTDYNINLSNNDDCPKVQHLFSSDHQLTLKMNGKSKPQKRRGRPPRPSPEMIEAQRIEKETQFKIQNQFIPDMPANEDVQEDPLKRKKRRVKIPYRFQEAVQGKELERIYVEKGVIDKVEYGSDSEDCFIEDISACESGCKNEIIGHLQSNDGKNMGDLVLIKSRRGKKNFKKGKTKFMCDICSKEFIHEYKFLLHRSSHHNVRYECIECLSQFSSRETFSEHQKATNHVGEGIIESLEEDKINCVVNRNINQEININTKTDAFKDSNEISTSFGVDVVNNLKDSLNEKDLFKSDFILYDKVNETINTNQNFESEACMKTEEKYAPKARNNIIKCDICDRVFNHYGSLVYHKESQHNKDRKFLCSKCDKCFTHRLLLQRHQRAHSNERPFACTLCPAKFKRMANLKNHCLKHNGVKKFRCSICDQQFAHKNSLDIHLRLHSGVKPYKCSMCPKSFSQNGNLKEHTRIHTGERPFKCVHCPKSFTTSSQCKNHIKNHLGDRPYACEICNKKFLYVEIFKTHMRRHNGEKPFFCMSCPKTFADNWSLRKHSRYHTGEKPFTCSYCGKHFADCSNLKKHKVNSCIPKYEYGKERKTKSKLKNVPIQPINNITSEDKKILEITESGEANEQIIYLSYQDSNETVSALSGLQVISELNSVPELTQDLNSSNIETSSNAMVITLNDPKQHVVLSSNIEENVKNFATQNILQLSEGGNDLLYRLQQSSREPDNLITSGEFSDHPVEYITEDGQKVQFLVYANPIELGTEFE